MRPSAEIRRLAMALLTGTLYALLAPPASAQPTLDFTTPAELNSNAPTDTYDDLNPAVTTDARGVWVAAWESQDTLDGFLGIDHDILFARSTDEGASWSMTTNLNTNAGDDSGLDRHVALAADGVGNWVAVWDSTDSLDLTVQTDLDILVSRSSNNGVAWAAPDALNATAYSDAAGDFEPHIATDSRGTWVAVWWAVGEAGLGDGPGWRIAAARSTNAGAAWSAPAVLTSHAASIEFDGGRPRVAANGLGAWVVVWYSNENVDTGTGSDTEILFCRSTDNARTWSAPAILNTGAASDSLWDKDPVIATDSMGNWLVVWSFFDFQLGAYGIDDDLFAARSANNGATWTAPTPVNTDARTDLESDVSPNLTTDRAGNWAVLWTRFRTANIGAPGGVQVQRACSDDEGRTWGPPARVSGAAARERSAELGPALAADGAGHWVAAWNSNDTLSKHIGSDADILTAAAFLDVFPTEGEGATEGEEEGAAEGEAEGEDIIETVVGCALGTTTKTHQAGTLFLVSLSLLALAALAPRLRG